MKYARLFLVFAAALLTAGFAYVAWSALFDPPVKLLGDPRLWLIRSMYVQGVVLFAALTYGYLRRRGWSVVLTTAGLVVWLIHLTSLMLDPSADLRPAGTTGFVELGTAVFGPITLWLLILRHRKALFDR